MSRLRSLLVVLLALVFFGQQPAAQGPTFALFERYLDAIRDQAGIPGLAGALVQSGRSEPVWQRGFGLAQVDEGVAVTPDTPFPLIGLTQVIGSTLVLRECIERGEATLEDALQRWSPDFSDSASSFRQVLSHHVPAGYNYSAGRFFFLTRAVEECADRPYPRVVADDILVRFGMTRSVPGGDVATRGSQVRQIFPVARIDEYEDILGKMAFPYRVDSSRRPRRSEYRVEKLTAADGLVSTVRDLARFDAALETNNVILRPGTLQAAQSRAGIGPTGLGWFVQTVNGRLVVWQFGLAENAYSSLMIKLPEQDITLYLLANSDGLAAQFPLANGDITVSPFFKIFFTLIG